MGAVVLAHWVPRLLHNHHWRSRGTWHCSRVSGLRITGLRVAGLCVAWRCGLAVLSGGVLARRVLAWWVLARRVLSWHGLNYRLRMASWLHDLFSYINSIPY